MGVSTVEPNFFYIDKNYVKDPSQVKVGQIVWIPYSYIPTVNQIISISRVDPKNLYMSEFVFQNLDLNTHFKSRSRLSVPALKLGSDEEAIFFKAKYRPCVLIEKSVELAKSKDFKGRSHQNCLVGQFVPILGLITNADFKGLPAVIAERADRLEYREFFYMPPFNCAGSTTTTNPLEGGIARFDRIFSHTIDSNGIKITDVMLTEQILHLFLAWFSLYCGLPQTKEQLENIELFRMCIKDIK